MTEIRNYMTTILILINWADLFPGYIWRDGRWQLILCYSVFITHVLIFINKKLVPHFHAKMIGLFTTPPPNLEPLHFWVLFFQKKTKKLSILIPWDWWNRIAGSMQWRLSPQCSPKKLSLLLVFNSLFLSSEVPLLSQWRKSTMLMD